MAFFSKSPWIIHYDGSSCNGCDIEVFPVEVIAPYGDAIFYDARECNNDCVDILRLEESGEMCRQCFDVLGLF